jgi:hypothetical protein
MELENLILLRKGNTLVILKMVNLMDKDNFIFRIRKYSILNGEIINLMVKESSR